MTICWPLVLLLQNYIIYNFCFSWKCIISVLIIVILPSSHFFIYILILRFVLYSVFLRIGVAWQTEVWAEVDISLPEFAWHLNVITQLLSP